MTRASEGEAAAVAGPIATRPSMIGRFFSKRPRRACFRAWTLAWIPILALAASPYDADFDAVMARYQLPGLAVGVIENGKVTYTRTAGELSAGLGQPVTPETLFQIGSNTKAMTTALLARLVQDGKLRWDDPVAKFLPTLRMYDPWVTRHLLLRDLLVHNSGLREGAGDLMLWPEPNRYKRADIIAGLAYLKPQASFRSAYAYDNILYIVAGEVAAAAGGAPYEDLMRREVFEPLALKSCRVGEPNRQQTGNVALPHTRAHGHNLLIDPGAAPGAAITSAAAGGISCSLNDMLSWALNWLDPSPSQRAWLGQEQRDALWTARTPMPISPRQRAWDHSHFYAYGFGWRLTDVDAVWSVSHTGSLGGMYSALSLLPDLRSGFVMLTNGEGSEARTVLSEVLLKHFTAPGAGRSAAEYADELAGESAAQLRPDALSTASRQPVTPAQMPAWLGIWRDPWFGEVILCGRGQKVRFNASKSPLLAGTVLRVGERYLVSWDNDNVDAEAWLRLAPGKSARAARLTMSKVDPQADFSFDFEDLSFTRVRACE